MFWVSILILVKTVNVCFPLVKQEGKNQACRVSVLKINLLLARIIIWSSGWINNLQKSVTAVALSYLSIGLRMFYAFTVITVQPVLCLRGKRRLSPEIYAKNIITHPVKSNFNRDYTSILKPQTLSFTLETIVA